MGEGHHSRIVRRKEPSKRRKCSVRRGRKESLPYPLFEDFRRYSGRGHRENRTARGKGRKKKSSIFPGRRVRQKLSAHITPKKKNFKKQGTSSSRASRRTAGFDPLKGEVSRGENSRQLRSQVRVGGRFEFLEVCFLRKKKKRGLRKKKTPTGTGRASSAFLTLGRRESSGNPPARGERELGEGERECSLLFRRGTLRGPA